MAAHMVIALACLGAASTNAQELETGAQIYAENCALCHGLTAQGDGEVAATVIADVPDLTKIAERRGGEFPFLEILDVVQGYAEGETRGARTMPFIGRAFALRGEKDANPVLARARLLELTYYLLQIQR